jgi:hypothetical protein
MAARCLMRNFGVIVIDFDTLEQPRPGMVLENLGIAHVAPAQNLIHSLNVVFNFGTIGLRVFSFGGFARSNPLVCLPRSITFHPKSVNR